jgi:FkbM family methyltransferase
MLGDRPLDLIRRSAVQPQQYVALARMLRRYPAAPEMMKRYLFGGGDYPYTCRVRTPTGIVSATLYSHHDVWTVNEVFAREDYRAGPELGVVVDVGSNIGISGLYFLSRNETSRCYLYEPVPRNVERLEANLTGHTDRYRLEQVAVADFDGEVDFAVEPTGRYGGLNGVGDERIRVRCRAIGPLLDEVLSREDRIDLLKLDTEGAERATLAAIDHARLARIDTILYETREPWNPDPDRFEMSFACETCRLESQT